MLMPAGTGYFKTIAGPLLQMVGVEGKTAA
jgi:hypothetical protein